MRALSEEKRELAAIAVEQTTKITRRWERLYPKYADELRSAAHMAAVRAAGTYDEAKGYSWCRWLRLCVKCETLKFMKTSYASKYDDGENLDDFSLSDESPDPSSSVDDYDMIQSLLSRLTERQREICDLVYYKGLTPYSAGEILGIRPENACKLHRHAIEKLRAMAAA